jgi:hypothetical protein
VQRSPSGNDEDDDDDGSTSDDAVATSSKAKVRKADTELMPWKRKRLQVRAMEADWVALAERFEEEGYWPILDAALEYASGTEHRFAEQLEKHMHDRSESMYMDHASNTLCVMPRALLKEVVTGSVAEAYENSSTGKTSPEFRDMLDELDEQGGKQACIYMLELADIHGDALGTYQIREIVKELRYYATKAQVSTIQFLHFKIDSLHDDEWEKSWSMAGNRRKYLEGKNPSERQAVIHVFCDALELLINGTEDGDDFRPGLTYIGYAIDAHARREQHSKTGSASTNWLSSLVVSICQVKWPTRGFELHFHVICLIGDEKQAAISEMLLAVITRSYYWTGRGFNIALCGISVGSIEMPSKPREEKTKLWRAWRHYILNNTPWEENVKWNAAKNKKLIENLQRVPIEATEARSAAKRVELEEFRTLMEEIDWDDPAIDHSLKDECERDLKDLRTMDRELLKLFRDKRKS